MPLNDLRAFSQITKKYLDKTESFEGYLRKNDYAVIFFNKTNLLLRGVIFQFRAQISKKVASHYEEHKKLGRQPNFQKFLATGGLVIPRRRLIGGEKFEIYLIFINFFYQKL